MLNFKNLNLSRKQEPSQETILGKDTPFLVAEAYKTIRTNLLFALPKSGSKAIAITSSQPSEGKSITAINVSIAFSQLGYKVLLVDADMRKPTIHKKMKLSKGQGGLSSILVGLCKFSDAVRKVQPNFDVLTSGPIPPNPSELLSSEAMADLIAFLEKQYDYVIFDTPPVNYVTDAIALGGKADGVVLVVRECYTTHDNLKGAISALEFAQIKLLGIVLSGNRNKKGRYGRYGKYKYYQYTEN